MEKVKEKINSIKIDNKRFKFGIDRDEENNDVREYVITGNQNIFNKIYQRRKPTIDYLAKKYNWLTEDAASEIRIVLVRTVNSYGSNGKKTDFNTFFYSSVKNHFSNLAKKRYRKKRTLIDGTDPLNRTSNLDSCIGDEDGALRHEFVSNDHEDIMNNINYNDLISMLSNGNKYVTFILQEFNNMTRKEIVDNDLLFNFSFQDCGENYKEDISKKIGLPNQSYEIVDAVLGEKEVKTLIKINGKNFISHIAKNKK